MINWVCLPGLTPYQEAMKIMQKKLHDVINGHNETIFLLEHSDVYSAGRNYDPNELLNTNNIPVIYTDRGGKFTYHGKGQKIIYPILNLKEQKKDIKLYVRNLEKWIIATLSQLGVNAYRIDGMVGVWVRHNNTDAKIAAIGIKIRKWVTYHGISVNLHTNLNNYSGIIPCGINDLPVCSLKQLGISISMSDFDEVLKNQFEKIFNIF